ncbi:hypothetical protein GJAV_G00141330 [Gymnothorax javanicus]|nr:hypothetical protein GJAV_G00141330 [Gymnothorax javanicus]
MAEMRCSVKSLAEFQSASRPAQVIRFGTEPETVISNGTDQMFTCRLDRGVTGTHTFPGRVTQLVLSPDGHGVYALCEHNGVYFSPLQQSHRTLSAGVSSGSSSSAVSAESCLLWDPQVRSILPMEQVLVTVGLGDGFWRFGLYKVPEAPRSGCRRLAELRIAEVSAAVSRDDHQRALHPVLCCVHADGGRMGPAHEGSHFLLEPVLFRLLFGVDASLLSSPIVLCGLPAGGCAGCPCCCPAGGQRSRVTAVGEPRPSGTHSDPPPPVRHAPLSLNVTGVLGLAPPTQDPSGAGQVLCVSRRGRLLQVTLPKESYRNPTALLSATQVGQRIRDLLSSIGGVAHRVSSLEGTVRSQRAALRSLNHALFTCSLLSANQDPGEEGGALQIQVTWAGPLQGDGVVLSCVLQNCSEVALEPGWALCVRLAPLCGPTLWTCTCPLGALVPGSSVELSVPLGEADAVQPPLKIRCWLLRSVQSMLGMGDMVGEGRDCLSLELNSLTLDWLDCLQPGESMGPKTSPRSGSDSDLVRTFLLPREAESPLRGEAGGVSTEGPSFAACVRVSCDLLKGALGPDLTPSAVLAWLLPSSAGFQSGEGRGSASVSVRCLGGDALQLSTREVSVAQASANGLLSAVELKISSASLRAVCALHHAVIRRLQVLLKHDARTKALPQRLQGQNLQQALLQAEVLCEAVLESHSAAALGVAQSQGSTHSLIQAYQRLREGQLLVL